jgi:hypothetical protein
MEDGDSHLLVVSVGNLYLVYRAKKNHSTNARSLSLRQFEKSRDASHRQPLLRSLVYGRHNIYARYLDNTQFCAYIQLECLV